MARSTPNARPDEPPREPNTETRTTSDPTAGWGPPELATRWPPGAWWDLAASAGLLTVALIAALAFPEGSVVRAAIAVPVLLIVPGYLLLQALFVPARPPSTRVVHGLIALGVSPALIGLLALSTVMLPGGFTAGAIFAVVTLTCLLLAAIALVRRARVEPEPPYTFELSDAQSN